MTRYSWKIHRSLHVKNSLSWVSRSQKTISLASTHAEYNAITELCKELIHVKHLLEFIQINPTLPIIIRCDNQGAIYLSKNQESRLSKHLDIKVHFIHSYVESGVVHIIFVRSEDNLADGLTKSCGMEGYTKNYPYLKNVF